MGNAESQKRHHSESSGKESQLKSTQHHHDAAASDDNVRSNIPVRHMSAGDVAHPSRIATEEVELITNNAKHQNKASSTQNSSVGMACTAAVDLSSETNVDVSSNELSPELETEPVVGIAVSCEEDFETADLEHVVVQEKLEHILCMVEQGEDVDIVSEEDNLFNTPTKCYFNKTDCVSAKDDIVCVSAPIPHEELMINSFAEKLLKDTFERIIFDSDFNTVESKVCVKSLSSPHRVPTIVISSDDSSENFVKDTENNTSDVNIGTTETNIEQNANYSEMMAEEISHEDVHEKVVVLIDELVKNVISEGLNSVNNNASDIKKVRFGSEPSLVADSDTVSEKNSIESLTDDCTVNHSNPTYTEKETLNENRNSGATISSAHAADVSALISETANSDRDSKLVLLAENITTDIILSSLNLIKSENNLNTVTEVLESLLNTVANLKVLESFVATNECSNRNPTAEENDHFEEDSNNFGQSSYYANSAVCYPTHIPTAASYGTIDDKQREKIDDERHEDMPTSADAASLIRDIEQSGQKSGSCSVDHEADDMQNGNADTLMVDIKTDSTEAGSETNGQSAMNATQSLSDIDVPLNTCTDQRTESDGEHVDAAESNNGENTPKDFLNKSAIIEESVEVIMSKLEEFISEDDIMQMLNESDEAQIHNTGTVENDSVNESISDNTEKDLHNVTTKQNENNSSELNIDDNTLEEKVIKRAPFALGDDSENQSEVEKTDVREVEEAGVPLSSMSTDDNCTDNDKNAIESATIEDQPSCVAAANQEKRADQIKSEEMEEETLSTEHSSKSFQLSLSEEIQEDSKLAFLNTVSSPKTLQSEEQDSAVLQPEKQTIEEEKDRDKKEETKENEETDVSEKISGAEEMSDEAEEMESTVSRQQRLADKGARLMKRKQQEAAGGMKLKSTDIKTSSTGSSSAVYNHSPSLSLTGDHASTISAENLSSAAELKSALNQLEEKYKQSMVQAAQLDNERSQLQYQTLQLKDLLEEQEDDFYRLKSEHKASCQEIEKQKRTINLLQKKCNDLQESLKQRDELIQEQGLVVVGENNREVVDGRKDPDDEYSSTKLALVTPEAAEVLHSAGDGPLDSRLKHLAEEKQELLNQVRLLKFELEEERRKIVVNGSDDALNSECRLPEMQLLEVQREANKVVSEYKLKLQKSEQDIAACHGNIARLESQVGRLKQTSENFEKNEDDMRAEKRKLMRDLRTALDRIEEMEMTNSHLEKRLERLRASRTAVNQT